jgi:hypothetical protein
MLNCKSLCDHSLRIIAAAAAMVSAESAQETRSTSQAFELAGGSLHQRIKMQTILHQRAELTQSSLIGTQEPAYVRM